MILRILNKIYREIYLLCHPQLWFKGTQINGIPKIGNISNLKLGRSVSFNEKCYIQCVGGVDIGDCVTISYDAVILTTGLDSNNYPMHCMTEMRKHIFAPVKIGEGSWIGARAMILPGVTIAPHSIVAAGSVVTKNLDKSGWLYGGIPAIPIKPLIKKDIYDNC